MKCLKPIKHTATTSARQDLLCFVDQSAFDLDVKAKLIRVLVPFRKSPQIRRIYVAEFDLFKLRGLKNQLKCFL